jgi:excisionase family DNA binding protein
MGVRHPSARRIKIHRTYTVEEIARSLGVHKHTVRRWEKAGLTAIDDHRPKLFRGPDVHAFLGARRAAAKRPSGPGEMYCFKCKGPRAPFGAVADLLPINAGIATLRGICTCGTLMHRRVSHRTVGAAARNLAVAIPEGRSRIGDKHTPTVNADYAEVWRLYAKSQRPE